MKPNGIRTGSLIQSASPPPEIKLAVVIPNFSNPALLTGPDTPAKAQRRVWRPSRHIAPFQHPSQRFTQFWDWKCNSFINWEYSNIVYLENCCVHLCTENVVWDGLNSFLGYCTNNFYRNKKNLNSTNTKLLARKIFIKCERIVS